MMQTTVKRNILSASGAPSGLRLFLFCRLGSASAATAFRFSPAPAQALLPFRFCPIFFPDRPICFFPVPSPTASSFGFQGLRFQSFDGIITVFCQPAAKHFLTQKSSCDIWQIGWEPLPLHSLLKRTARRGCEKQKVVKTTVNFLAVRKNAVTLQTLSAPKRSHIEH